MEVYEEDFETLDEIRHVNERPRLSSLLSRKRIDKWELDNFMNGN
jgi:hypothetical protein